MNTKEMYFPLLKQYIRCIRHKQKGHTGEDELVIKELKFQKQ